ncbi:hypothetical protein KHS38_12270 [Mucilaginibacter sp. Bleaf8]|uniref:hypothetical protein n=1 Tax=Mucilaginibacter sp. Bleaf8 TaxID=2834430 RepID=UPI001BCFD2D6|nr:hypothetical protein [Mucilaginibacter sp. Bleaf8]MBS7565179.1 hypothetical protein [Mucilaginibacter sp. Bleaf8]
MPTENKPVSELYSVSRMQIEHYDMSIGLRLIWLNNSQAFMFGVYSVCTIMKAPTPFLAGKELMLAMAIPFLGFATTLVTLFDIITSIIQMNKLTRNYKNANSNHEQELNFPLLHGNIMDRVMQRISPVVTALLFLAVWIFLIMYDHQLL